MKEISMGGSEGLNQFSRRSIIAGAFMSLAYAAFGEKLFGATLKRVNVILGRPTNSTIAISVISATPLALYIEYGYSPTKLTKKTSQISLSALNPSVVELKSLTSSSTVYYRVRSTASGENAFDLG